MAHDYVREPLNQDEYDRFVNSCITFREKLVIWTLLDTGLRVSVVPLTARVSLLFQTWFTINDRIGLSPRSIQRLVKKVANKARIIKPVTPHTLRHTFATNCVKKGVSTASLKKILGHDRLETTEIYLNICPEDALSEFFRKVENAA